MNVIDQQLFAACQNGDRLQVKTLLAQGANPNALDETRQTPLMVAARHGHIAIIDLLIRHGAKRRAKDRYGRNALHHAVENRKYDAARHLIFKYKLDPRESTYDDQDILSIAAGNGDVEFMDFIVEHGAKPRIKALEEAILKRQVHAVRHLILNGGLDPNCVTNFGVTPFLIAARVGDISILDTLAELGASPHHSDVLGQNALHIATKKHHHDMMRHLLVCYRLDPNARTLWDETPLLMAAENGDIVAIDLLLQHGACPHLTDRDGYDALLKAVANRHLALVSHLLRHCSLDVNQPCHDGRTAFLIAADNHDIPMLDLLAQSGANPHHCDNDKNNAMTFARKDRDTVHHLITRYGVDPNLEDARGRTPLFLLVEERDDEDPLIHLIKHGADPHYVNRYGQNAIHFAVRRSHHAIIRCLAMTLMVNPDQPDHKGLTPFLLAAQTGDVRMLHLLAMLGANPYHTDHIGRSALHLAAENGHLEAIRYLITRLHFDPNALDHEGYSPLARAMKETPYRGTDRYRETIQTLIALGGHRGVGQMNGGKALDKDPFIYKDLLRISPSEIVL